MFSATPKISNLLTPWYPAMSVKQFRFNPVQSPVQFIASCFIGSRFEAASGSRPALFPPTLFVIY
jgi:hypothetical protein